MSRDLERRAVGKEIGGQTVGQQEPLSAGVDERDLTARPPGLWASRAEGQHRQMHQMRMPRGDPLGVERLPRTQRDRRVVDEDLRVIEQRRQAVPPRRCLKIADHAALVRSEIFEQGAAAVLQQRRLMPQRAKRGRLDHDDFGPHDGQKPPGPGPGHAGGMLHNPDPGEWLLL